MSIVGKGRAVAVDGRAPTVERAQGRRWVLTPPRRLDRHAIRFEQRHRVTVLFLLLHAPALLAVAVARGHSLGTGLLVSLPLVVVAALAWWSPFGQRVRAILATIGLLATSATLVHLTNGLIESHFHVFVVLGLLAFYRDMVVFVLAAAFVAFHHGVVGVLHPEAVYNHEAAWQAPVRWGLVHAGYLGAAAALHLVNWRIEVTTRSQLAAAEARRGYARQLNDDVIQQLALVRYASEIRDWDALDQALDRTSASAHALVEEMLDAGRVEPGELRRNASAPDVDRPEGR